MVDACRIGWCEFYSTGGGTIALIVGGTIGAVLIALLIRHRRQRSRDRDE